MRNISDKLCREKQTRVLCPITFFVPCMSNAEIYGRPRQVADDSATLRRKMRFACWVTKARIQKCTQNMWYLLLFHGKNIYMNAPQCFLIRTLNIMLFMLPNYVTLRSYVTTRKTGKHRFWLYDIKELQSRLCDADYLPPSCTHNPSCIKIVLVAFPIISSFLLRRLEDSVVFAAIVVLQVILKN
jgi:hypothetical protein